MRKLICVSVFALSFSVKAQTAVKVRSGIKRSVKTVKSNTTTKQSTIKRVNVSESAIPKTTKKKVKVNSSTLPKKKTGLIRTVHNVPDLKSEDKKYEYQAGIKKRVVHSNK